MGGDHRDVGISHSALPTPHLKDVIDDNGRDQIEDGVLDHECPNSKNNPPNRMHKTSGSEKAEGRDEKGNMTLMSFAISSMIHGKRRYEHSSARQTGHTVRLAATLSVSPTDAPTKNVPQDIICVVDHNLGERKHGERCIAETSLQVVPVLFTWQIIGIVEIRLPQEYRARYGQKHGHT